MTRSQIEPRVPLNRMQFAYLAVLQDGKCGCGCGEPLDFLTPRAVTDEHVVALSMLGSNDLDNRSLWRTVPCAREKTRGEAPVLAKAKRMARETGQQARLAKRKAEGRGSRLQGRGFSKPPGYKHTWPSRRVGQ